MGDHRHIPSGNELIALREELGYPAKRDNAAFNSSIRAMGHDELVRRYIRLLKACNDMVACGKRCGDGSYTVTGDAMRTILDMITSDAGM